MPAPRDASPLSARVLRRTRAAAAALLVDLVRLEAGLARLEPDDLTSHPEARALAKLICETPGLLASRIDELAEATLALRYRRSATARSQPLAPFIVRLADLAAPSYLELLLEAARRHVALLVQSASAAGVASNVSDRELRLQWILEPPTAPVSYMTLGACVEQELRAIEQNAVDNAAADVAPAHDVSADNAARPIESAAAILGTISGTVSSAREASQPERKPRASANPSESGRGLLSCADLAATFGVDQERLRGRLKRWQRTCFTGWVEVTDRGPRDPQYLYQVASVMPIIHALQERQQEKQ